MLNPSALLYSIHRVIMPGSDDSHNDLREREVDMSSGTSPDASSYSSEDPDTPSSHGLPKAANRARIK